MNKLAIILLSLTIVNCTAPSVVVKVKEVKRSFEVILVKDSKKLDRKDKVVIAVIDTGFNKKYMKDVKLCNTGHKSFVDKKAYNDPMYDEHGHGTHIAGLIAKNIKVDYCLVIIKYYSPYIDNGNIITKSNEAFRYAIDLNVDMINYSSGGVEPDNTEQELIKEALGKNIVIAAAAGNEGKSFKHQAYYPAMYDKRIIVVGNLTTNENGKAVRAPTSNYGKQVDVQVFGTNIRSVNGAMTGTSQSTAIVTGRIAKYVKDYRLTEAMRKLNNQGRDNYHSPLYKYMRQ